MAAIYSGKVLRLKTFVKDDRVLIVAMDHGIAGITEGLENLGKTIDSVARAGADAVMINVGVIRNYYEKIAGKVPVVATIEYVDKSVEQAVKAGANAVKTTYFGKIPPDESLRQWISQIASKCDEWGIPYMAELVPVDASGKFIFDVDLVKKAARLAAELGADLVKTAFTGNREGFARVTEACPIPVVIAGGPAIDSDKDTLKMVKDTVEAGGAGVAFGRNIWQRQDPAKMTEAIAKIIHQNISVEEALRILK